MIISYSSKSMNSTWTSWSPWLNIVWLELTPLFSTSRKVGVSPQYTRYIGLRGFRGLTLKINKRGDKNG